MIVMETSKAVEHKYANRVGKMVQQHSHVTNPSPYT